MTRTALDNRWVSEQWQPSEVLAIGEGRGAPGAPQCLVDTPERTSWRFPALPIELHATEAEGHHLNLTSETPVVFVLWRMHDDGGPPPARPLIVTLSYNEAARFMDGGERVDPVPMPEPIRAWLARFVAENYKPEPKRKVRRNDPFADDAPRRS